MYQLPPDEFTAARNALAKTLKGDAGRQVKQLRKPTAVPGAINNLYLKARMVYERLMKAGEQLREAQVAALQGGTADLRAAADAHRDAVATAVRHAVRLAGPSGAPPPVEPLARMLEALSLAPNRPAHPGRLTDLVQPAGFEALAGVRPAPRPDTAFPTAGPGGVPLEGKDGDAGTGPGSVRSAGRADRATRGREAAEKNAADRAAARRLQQIAVAELALTRAEAHQARAERDLDRAQTAVVEAREALKQAVAAVREAERQLASARDDA